MRGMVVGMIRIYQWGVSPLIHWVAGPGSGCRFEPSCSEYCAEAVRLHGTSRGLRLGMRRICRCHPWGGAGADPVPPPRVQR
jgi:putative membrane protein insertion efficiency factor